MSTTKEHAGKVIITCAITGAIHTPSMSPHLPVTPDEIIAESLAAAEAGAAILHLHARNPEDGRPDQSPEGFAAFLPFLGAAFVGAMAKNIFEEFAWRGYLTPRLPLRCFFFFF